MINAIQTFQSKYSQANNAAVLISEQGMLLSCNTVFEVFFDCDAHHIKHTSINDLWFDDESTERFASYFNEYKLSSKSFQFVSNHSLTAKSKKGFLTEVNFVIEYFAEEAEPFFVVTVFKSDGARIDLNNLNLVILGLESTNNALKVSEQQFELAQVVGNMGHWRLDYTTNELIWSKHIYTIFELNPNTFKGTYEAFIEMVHPDDRKSVDEAFNRHVNNKETYNIEHRLLMPDGRIKWVHERCSTSYNSKNQPIESLGIVQDITDRKKFEEQAMLLVSRIRTYSFLNSHKLRAPVSNILGLGELLETLTNESELKQCVKHIVDSTKLLDHELQKISILLSPEND